MKTLLTCGMLALSLFCLSCANSNQAPLEGETGALGETLSRKQLYAAFPPLVKPTPNPLMVTSNGSSGFESFPISDKYEITYAVRYTVSSGKQDTLFNHDKQLRVSASPQDEVSGYEIRERN